MSTCEICGRREVDPMTLNSTPIDKTMCYQRETGGDPRCKQRIPGPAPTCPHNLGLNCRVCYPKQYK